MTGAIKPAAEMRLVALHKEFLDARNREDIERLEILLSVVRRRSSAKARALVFRLIDAIAKARKSAPPKHRRPSIYKGRKMVETGYKIKFLGEILK